MPLPGSIDLFTEAFFQQPEDLPPCEMVAVENKLTLPGDILSGEYVLSIAVVGEKTVAPVVQLGIGGREPDGWYRLSKIRIEQR